MKKVLTVVFILTALGMLTACSEEQEPQKEKSAIETFTEEKTEEEAVEEPEITGTVETDDVEITEDSTGKKSEKETETAEGEKQTKKNVFADMTQEECVELNKFISNFTEAMCDESVNYDAEKKISFAFIHCGVNGGYENDVVYSGEKMGISANAVDVVLERFFGESVPHQSPADGEWEYEDGFFMKRAASGETYSYFAIATDLIDNGDGTYTAKFNEYHDDEDVHDFPKQEWYLCDADKASEKYKFLGSYEAIIKPKTVNGSATYEMVEFKS